MQLLPITTANHCSQSFQGKGSLNTSKIKVTNTPDSVILSNKSKGTAVEILTFPEKEIKKLQAIAEKIYTRKICKRSK